TGAEDRYVLAAFLSEATQAIEELHAGRLTRDLKLGSGRSARRRDPRRRSALVQAIEVIDEPSTLSDQNHTRDGQEKGSHLGRGLVGAQHEDVPQQPIFANLRPGLAGPHQGLQRGLELLKVGGGALVDDN